jgi:ABC-type thiamine transport system ATPase subunit
VLAKRADITIKGNDTVRRQERRPSVLFFLENGYYTHCELASEFNKLVFPAICLTYYYRKHMPDLFLS